MKETTSSRQTIKQHFISLFEENDFQKIRTYCQTLETAEWTNPLFSLLYHPASQIKWSAVLCLGEQVAHLAETNPEGARILFRRLIWNLNDESGGIGWGSPEVMGEIIAQSEKMAQEYHRIFISYINPCGNYLELPLLRQGAVWGIGRAAQVRPQLFPEAISFLLNDLQNPLPSLRGHVIWALGILRPQDKATLLSPFISDSETFELYTPYHVKTVSIAQITQQALSA